MDKRFNELGISEPILKALEEMGFERPTEVQSKAIPQVLNKQDLIVMSKTGSGKTAAFGVPMLQLINPEDEGPKGLILTPTRELAVQVDSDIRLYSRNLPFKTTAVYGQHSMNTEIQALKKGVSIVTGTPGRVFDHIRQGNLVTKHISFLVLDEADRMLDMGFIDQVVRIVKTLPKERVTMLFSATMPYEVRDICRQYMNRPATIEIESETKTVDTIHQIYYRVAKNEKRTQLHRLLTVEQPDSCMIFCNTRAEVDRVQEHLTRKGYPSLALHGDIPQSKRMKTIQQFKQGDFNILVATDVAARGLHVEDLALVINYDVPNEKDSYVHRIGRTGRAGNGGRAITLATGDDIMSLYDIEEHTGAMIAEEELPTDELYQQKKASAAEKWAKYNVPKHSERSADHPRENRGPRSSEGRGQGQRPKKKPSAQPAHEAAPGGSSKTHPGDKNRPKDTHKGERAEHPPRRKPEPSQSQRKPAEPRKPRPEHPHRHPAHQGEQRRTTGTVHQHAEKVPAPKTAPALETKSQPAPEAKPSFLQRVIKKLFG